MKIASAFITGGTVDVEPVTVKDGLAIVPYVRRDGSKSKGFYRIAHVESGLLMPANGITYKLRQAARVLSWLLELHDWTGSRDKVIKSMAIGRREILGALLRLEINDWRTSL